MVGEPLTANATASNFNQRESYKCSGWRGSDHHLLLFQPG
jgi:hypothetical protein